MINFSVPRLIFIIKLSLTVMIGLNVILYILHFYRPTPEYYLYNKVKQQTKRIYAIDRPNVSSQSLLSWSTLAVSSAYTLNFVQIDESLNNLKQYFTNSGFINFNNAIAGNIETIKARKLEQTAVVINTPIILSEGVILGIYTWKIQIPILITYQGAGGQPTQSLKNLTITVTRVPTTEAPKGIGIAQIIEGSVN